MNVCDAIRRRHSTRAFLDAPVSQQIIEQILEAARWAPSGVNTQPWQVAVVSGETKQRITEALIEARRQGVESNPDYAYYPKSWREPYRARRKACGLALYDALDIRKDDKERQLKAWENNYRFFGAPVGLLFFIDRQMAQGSWVDMGMFLQNVMLAALDQGLATCPQASLAEYPDRVRSILGLPDDLNMVCGMSLGHEDTTHPVNNYRTDRLQVCDFTRFYE
jgi:nitroreductase